MQMEEAPGRPRSPPLPVAVEVGELVAYEYADPHRRSWGWCLATVTQVSAPRILEVSRWMRDGEVPPTLSLVSGSFIGAACDDGSPRVQLCSPTLSQPRTTEGTRLAKQMEETRQLLESAVLATQQQVQTVQQRQTAIEDGKRVVEGGMMQAAEQLKGVRKAVHSVNVRHWRELRSYRNPPPIVTLILDSVMLVIGEQARTWPEVQAVIRQNGFVTCLSEFDPATMAPETLRQLQQHYLNSPRYTTEEARKGSIALESLQQWVVAVVAAQEASISLRQFRRDEARMYQEMEDLHSEMWRLEDHVSELQSQLDELTHQFEEAESDRTGAPSEFSATEAGSPGTMSPAMSLRGQVCCFSGWDTGSTSPGATMRGAARAWYPRTGPAADDGLELILLSSVLCRLGKVPGAVRGTTADEPSKEPFRLNAEQRKRIEAAAAARLHLREIESREVERQRCNAAMEMARLQAAQIDMEQQAEQHKANLLRAQKQLDQARRENEELRRGHGDNTTATAPSSPPCPHCSELHERRLVLEEHLQQAKDAVEGERQKLEDTVQDLCHVEHDLLDLEKRETQLLQRIRVLERESETTATTRGSLSPRTSHVKVFPEKDWECVVQQQPKQLFAAFQCDIAVALDVPNHCISNIRFDMGSLRVSFDVLADANANEAVLDAYNFPETYRVYSSRDPTAALTPTDRTAELEELVRRLESDLAASAAQRDELSAKLQQVHADSEALRESIAEAQRGAGEGAVVRTKEPAEQESATEAVLAEQREGGGEDVVHAGLEKPELSGGVTEGPVRDRRVSKDRRASKSREVSHAARVDQHLLEYEKQLIKRLKKDVEKCEKAAGVCAARAAEARLSKEETEGVAQSFAGLPRTRHLNDSSIYASEMDEQLGERVQKACGRLKKKLLKAGASQRHDLRAARRAKKYSSASEAKKAQLDCTIAALRPDDLRLKKALLRDLQREVEELERRALAHDWGYSSANTPQIEALEQQLQRAEDDLRQQQHLLAHERLADVACKSALYETLCRALGVDAAVDLDLGEVPDPVGAEGQGDDDEDHDHDDDDDDDDDDATEGDEDSAVLPHRPRGSASAPSIGGGDESLEVHARQPPRSGAATATEAAAAATATVAATAAVSTTAAAAAVWSNAGVTAAVVSTAAARVASAAWRVARPLRRCDAEHPAMHLSVAAIALVSVASLQFKKYSY